MAGKIIMWLVSFGCAAMFYAIGVCAGKMEKPMWFWAGSEVPASKITDVAQYNKENGVMWRMYSLWYWAAGLAEFWDTVVAAILLALGGTVGIGLLIGHYGRIYKKYGA